MSEIGLREIARNIASEAVDWFSAKYPHIRMNRNEWDDLLERIQIEVIGHGAQLMRKTHE